MGIFGVLALAMAAVVNAIFVAAGVVMVATNRYRIGYEIAALGGFLSGWLISAILIGLALSLAGITGGIITFAGMCVCPPIIGWLLATGKLQAKK